MYKNQTTMEHLCRRFRFVSLLYVFLRSEFIHPVQKEAAISLVVVIYLYKKRKHSFRSDRRTFPPHSSSCVSELDFISVFEDRSSVIGVQRGKFNIHLRFGLLSASEYFTSRCFFHFIFFKSRACKRTV